MPDPTYSYDQEDPDFLDDLHKSGEAVDSVKNWLLGKGYPVIVMPVFERPEASRMTEFSDNGDLAIISRVEVKRRLKRSFTSKDDFNDKIQKGTIIVDSCHVYDQAHPKPRFYIILNHDMTTGCFIDVTKTIGTWERTSRFDQKKGRLRHFYTCPVANLPFFELPAAKP